MDRRYRKRMDRHWAAAEAKARRTIDQLDPHSWFDLWHTHIDWYGRGNNRAENRRSVALVAVRLLEYLDSHLGPRVDPIQTWAMICPNTMDTAVYAHSANPNESAFPVELKVSWLTDLPEELAQVVPAGFEVGVAADGTATQYIVWRGPNNSFKPKPLRGSA